MYKFLKRTAVFLLGSYAIVVQVIFLREFLVIFLGNELCFGIIFSSWFMGVGLGAAASARASRKTREGEGPFLFLAALLAALSPVILFLIRILRKLLSIPPGEYIPFISLLFSTWVLVVPFSFIIGFVFPFACLLAIGGERREIRNIGSVYILEALGSMSGGALFSFLFVGRVSAFHILFGWGAVVLFVLFLLSRERLRGQFAISALGVLWAAFFLFLITGVAAGLDSLSVRLRWESLNPKLPLVTSVDSRYENIALGKLAEQYDLFGNGQYYFSFPDPYGYAATAHMIMSEHPDPKSVLLIGGGVGGMIRELLEYDLERLDYVELDPLLIKVTERYLDPGDREALKERPVTVYHGDGRRFVKETKRRYDLVIINVPDPSTAMLNRFYTLEFFREVRKILAPGGAMTTSISAPVDYYGWEVGNYAGSIYRTLRAVFPYVIVTPTEENYFFASIGPGVVTSDIHMLQERWRSRGIKTEYFTPYHFLMWWLPERVEFVKNSLEAQREALIDTDFRPITYFFNLVLWARFSGSRVTGFLREINKIGLIWYTIPILFLLVGRLAYIIIFRRRGSRQSAFHALLAIGTTGFTAMALEIILIYAFQNIYGYVYQMIGMIVALFMTGLAIGGYGSNRLLLRPDRRWNLWLAGMEFALATYAILIPLLVRSITVHCHGSEYAFMALVFLAGFLTGAEFPIAGKIYMNYASNLGRSAALVDGFDHFGACVGSLFTGIIAVPLLGLGASCVLLMLMNVATGILLLVKREA